MSKQYQVKQVETNSRGYKVTRTLSTEDEEEIKSLIGFGSKDSSAKKKDTKTTKKTASNKTTKPGNKKGVVIDAEFTEVKGSKKSKPKEVKTTVKKTVAKPKALPTPKKKEVLKSNKKTYTSLELKRKLRSMKPYHDELILGNEVVIKSTKAYGVRPIWDHDDSMRDYSAYTYGFKEKEIIDLAKRKGLVKD